MPRKTIQKNLAYDTERQLYYAVFRQDGRRYTRTYRTREEAQAALEGNSCADRRLPGKDCTLGEWLTFWLEEVVARDRAESTLYAYRNMARCHVLPALGRIPLAELTPLRIQGYLYEKMNQGLSPNTVIKHYVMLTTALGMAVRLEMLERSPMDRVTPPKKKEARFSFYSPEQLQLLFSAVSGTMMELPVKLAAYLGLRRSEICGLRWEDFDDAEGTLKTIRSVSSHKAGALEIGETKTNKGRRIISLPDSAAQRLRERKETAISDWIFPNPLHPEEPVNPGYAYNRMKTILKNARLPSIRFHDLRHTFATIALGNGMDVKTLSAMLGHVSAATTLDIYTHITNPMRSEAAAKIDQKIGKAAPQELPAEPQEKRTMTTFQPYAGRKRKPGTGCITQISENCWEGRYSPEGGDQGHQGEQKPGCYSGRDQ